MWNKRNLRTGRWLFAAALFIFTSITCSVFGQDTNAVPPGDAPLPGGVIPLLTLAIAGLVPALIALVKQVAPRIPGAWWPWLAPALGMVLDWIGHLAGVTSGNPLLGAVLGAAGVGLRELLVQSGRATGLLATKVGLILALALPIGFTGCATMGPQTSVITPADAELIAFSAGSLGVNAYLTENPKARPAFEAVHASLGALVISPNLGAANLLAVLTNLPIQELKGERGVVIVTGIVTVQGLLRNRVSVTNEYAMAVARGLYNGLGLALGKPSAKAEGRSERAWWIALAAAPAVMLRIEYKKDRKGEHRARLVHRNGNVLFVSSESYKRRRSATNAVRSIASAFKTGDYNTRIV